MSHSSSDVVRKKDTGEPGNGGQFGTAPKAGSGLALDASGSEAQRFIEDLSPQDRELALALLDPAFDEDEAISGTTMDERFADLADRFQLGIDKNSTDDVQAVSEIVAAKARFQQEADSFLPYLHVWTQEENYTANTAAYYETRIGIDTDATLRVSSGADELGNLNPGDATGFGAALEVAKNVERRFADITQRTRALKPRPMTFEDMQGASKVMDFKAREARVRFALDDSGDIHEGVVRSGTFRADGATFPPADVRDGYVRITMKSGGEWFIPTTDLIHAANHGGIVEGWDD